MYVHKISLFIYHFSPLVTSTRVWPSLEPGDALTSSTVLRLRCCQWLLSRSSVSRMPSRPRSRGLISWERTSSWNQLLEFSLQWTLGMLAVLNCQRIWKLSSGNFHRFDFIYRLLNCIVLLSLNLFVITVRIPVKQNDFFFCCCSSMLILFILRWIKSITTILFKK